MKSFKDLLKEKIEKEGYVSYGDLVNFAGEESYKISSLDRRMRELCNEFPIEAIEKKSKRGSLYISGYKLKETKMFTGFKTLPDPNKIREIDNITFTPFAVINGKELKIFAAKKENKKGEVEVKRDDRLL